MSVANVSQAIASQHEFLRPELEELALLSGTLWKRISKGKAPNGNRLHVCGGEIVG